MHFRIHQEGWIYFISSIILTIIFFPFIPIISILFLIISIYIFYFFRDPKRAVPNDDFIISPADGIVTFIGKSNYPIEIISNNECVKVSIFLNIFNVHVNRIPVSGRIDSINYISGKFFNASLDKSSKDNERNIISIKNKKNELIVVSQIAGLIARRIVCNLKENQDVIKGNRFGIIKFGSRVDLYLPLNYKLLVTEGQNVVAGETIISNPENILELKNGIKI